jgi:hypothetical protein
MAIRSFQNRLRKLQDGIATCGLVRAPRPITEDMTAEQAALEYQLTVEQGPPIRRTFADDERDRALPKAEQQRLVDLYVATLKASEPPPPESPSPSPGQTESAAERRERLLHEAREALAAGN